VPRARARRPQGDAVGYPELPRRPRRTLARRSSSTCSRPTCCDSFFGRRPTS
jgi:hypothetical protein